MIKFYDITMLTMLLAYIVDNVISKKIL